MKIAITLSGDKFEIEGDPAEVRQMLLFMSGHFRQFISCYFADDQLKPGSWRIVKQS
jgi:hypothetical protein